MSILGVVEESSHSGEEESSYKEAEGGSPAPSGSIYTTEEIPFKKDPQ